MHVKPTPQSRALFRPARAVYYEIIHARLERGVPSRFFCATRRTPRKLRHHCSRLALPLSPPRFLDAGRRFLPLLPLFVSPAVPRLRVFSSTFRSQKAGSRFILSTRAGLKLFCLLARGHLNGVPAPLKRAPFPSCPFASRRASRVEEKRASATQNFTVNRARRLPKRRKKPRKNKKAE